MDFKFKNNWEDAYESPVAVVMKELNTQVDEGIIKYIQGYGIDVDKEELLKALKYDREQFEKGYKAGYAKALNECTEQILPIFEHEWATTKLCDMFLLNDLHDEAEAILNRLKGEENE